MDTLIIIKGIFQLCFSILLFTFFAYLSKLSRGNSETSINGKMILKYPKVLSIVGYFGIILFSLVEIIFLFFNHENLRFNIFFSCTFLSLIFVGIFLVLNARVKIVVDEDKIEKNSISGHYFVIYWHDIKSINFTNMGMLNLISDKGKIKIDINLQGFDSFVDMIKRKVPFEIYNNAIQRIQKARQKEGF